MNNIVVLLIALIFGLVLYHKVFRSSYSDGSFKVYGTPGCSWTRKQLEFLGKTGTFYNCDNGECPPGIKSFPTIISPYGQTYVGYTTKFEAH